MKAAEVFFEALDTDMPRWLLDIEEEHIKAGIPVIKRPMQSLLNFEISVRQPRTILEIGTGGGFSALLMWEASGRKSRIMTIENREDRAERAFRTFKEYGADKEIELIKGDAKEVLQSIDSTAELVFMDAAKGQYQFFLPEALRILKPGGILVSDNILQDGDMIRSRYAIRRRDRTIHSRMREYLWELKHTEGLKTMMFSDGDGMAVTVKEKI